jgi:hypothetical protein
MFKAHRRNTNFQIQAFVEGGCHTPDAAWFTLKEQLEERKRVVRGHEINEKIRVHEKRELKRRFDALPEDESKRSIEDLRVEAQWLTWQDNEPVVERMMSAARAELQFIESRIAAIEPQTLYVKRYLAGELSFDQAAQLAQPEEWLRELIFRAQNFLMTQGTIPHDHYAAMRRHPEFQQRIWPVISLEMVRLSNMRRRLARGIEPNPERALPGGAK